MMEIASPVRLAVGIAFLLVALVLAPRAFKERGFGKMRQGAALSLLAAALFTAAGFGFSPWGRS